MLTRHRSVSRSDPASTVRRVIDPIVGSHLYHVCDHAVVRDYNSLEGVSTISNGWPTIVAESTTFGFPGRAVMSSDAGH